MFNKKTSSLTHKDINELLYLKKKEKAYMITQKGKTF